MMAHYGYLLRGQLTGLYKVGITAHPTRRFRQYRTHTPERIFVEGRKQFLSKDEAEDWESIILDLYSDAIQHGEWLDIEFGEAANIWTLGLEHPASAKIRGRCLIIFQIQCMGDEPYRARVFECEDGGLLSEMSYMLEDQFVSWRTWGQCGKKIHGFRPFQWPRLITREFLNDRNSRVPLLLTAGESK
jgi:hypothetical protein